MQLNLLVVTPPLSEIAVVIQIVISLIVISQIVISVIDVVVK